MKFSTPLSFTEISFVCDQEDKKRGETENRG